MRLLCCHDNTCIQPLSTFAILCHPMKLTMTMLPANLCCSLSLLPTELPAPYCGLGRKLRPHTTLQS